MANHDYSPDQREFYERAKQFGNLSMIMGGAIRTVDPEEDQYVFASGENYRAFAASRLPWEPSPEETINKIIDIIPEMKVNKKLWAERRKLSEQARNAILNAAVRKVMETKTRSLNLRMDYVLLVRGDANEVKEQNDQRERQLKGTNEDRGRLLEERVQESLELYNRILNEQVSVQELVDNFEEIHKVLDLVMNAQLFVPAALPDEVTGEIYYKISDDTVEILRDMERRANEVAMFISKIRQIANPNYEFLNLEIIQELKQDAIDTLTEKAAPEDEDDYVFDDIIAIGNEIKGYKDNVLNYNLQTQFAKDFPLEVETAKLQFAGSDGELKDAKCVYKAHDNTVQNYMDEGYALVTTPSGDAACYHVDKRGRVTSAVAADMLNYMPSDTKDLLKQMKDANKGLFIGSKEYSTSLKNMEKAFETVQKLGNPPSPEKKDKAAAYYRTVLAECEKYVEKKMTAPPTAAQQAILDQLDEQYRELTEEDRRNAMSPRERLRFDTMKKTITFCKKQLALLNLHTDAAAAEKKAIVEFHRTNENVAYPKVDRDAVSNKVYFDYAPEHLDWNNNMEQVSNVIPASDVGNIADELRENVEKRLESLVLDSDPDEARWVMSDMVVLELVKMGRGTDEHGNHLAGDLEKQLAETPGAVISSFRNDPHIRAMTQDMSTEKLRNFVMNNGAKTMAEHITKMVKKQADDAAAKAKKQELQNDVKDNAQPDLVPNAKQ